MTQVNVRLQETDVVLDSLRELSNQKRIVEYEQRLKGKLRASGYSVTIGNHGIIFVTPSNGGWKKSFDTIEQAYNHYFANN
jgi:hypothetical protein